MEQEVVRFQRRVSRSCPDTPGYRLVRFKVRRVSFQEWWSGVQEADQTSSPLERFLVRLRNAGQSVLLLDYDGTLAPFRQDTHKATPYPGVRDCLNSILEQGCCRLIIVTGRAVQDLKPLLQLRHPTEVWGSHGRERLLTDGTYLLQELSPDTQEQLSRTRDWVRRKGLKHWLEEKPGCLAIHFRGRDPLAVEEVRAALTGHWEAMARDGAMEMHTFDGGIEFRAQGTTKGSAVRTILSEVGEDTPVAYLGDDLTDEDAFRALGDRGLGVLVRREPRPTAADLRISPPEELLDFLKRWMAASGCLS